MRTSLDYVNDYYRVNARVGQVVTYNGKRGVITTGMGNYVGIVLEGERAADAKPYHPRDENLVYLDETVPLPKMPKMTRAQENYNRYLETEHSSFADFLGIRTGYDHPRYREWQSLHFARETDLRFESWLRAKNREKKKAKMANVKPES